MSVEIGAGSASAPRDAYTPQPNAGSIKIPPAGHYGHGTWACQRRPIPVIRARPEGGYAGRYEVIRPGCGDNPRLRYTKAGHHLQRVREPYPLNERLAAYERHIGAN